MEDTRPVYRLVDGQKVRIPGDVRDPKRRYSLVADDAGGHYLEFTDGQEQQRDLEEAQWEAERPQREALANQQEEQWEAFKASLKYEDHIIAYLDVLGWKDAIAQSAKDGNLVRTYPVKYRKLISAQPSLKKAS
jgi:hypothetical protein